MTDRQARIRSTAERAFQHIQRSIAADPDIQRKWKTAFDAGETNCESLGATHLLLHGIFAFKINASGARTDLVFPETSLTDLEPDRFSDGLVLTEWKKVKEQDEAEQKLAEARRQASRYADGPMATTELRDRRYLVMVTRKPVTLAPCVIDGATIYRHINIAVDPLNPSVEAKRNPGPGKPA